MRVSNSDFDIRYAGCGNFCVFKPPEDRVGVLLHLGVEDLEELGGGIEKGLTDLAVWAWNSALEEVGSVD
jgi:hypothetical protein